MDNRNFDQKQNNETDLLDELIKKLTNAVQNLNEENVKEFVSGANDFASKFISAISSSKLRNFYDEIKSIVESNKDDFKKTYTQLYLIKPKIAYAIGREASSDVRRNLQSFQKLYDNLMEILSADNLDNFVKLMEAIVAYHKEIKGNR